MGTFREMAKASGVLSLLALTTIAQLPSPYPICPSGANCNTPAPCGSACTDNDNDGLCDSWEIAGGLDLNGDGIIEDEHDLLLPGADPSRPDIYLQYDWMIQPGRNGHSHRPHPQTIRAAVDAFARQGFVLHAFPGHPVQHYSVVTFDPVDPACAGNDAVNFFDLKAISFPPQRALAYHYAVFGHYLTCDSVAHCAQCPPAAHPAVFGATGQAELPGNDVIVTTGIFLDFGLTPTVVEEAGLLMHELGHNLGLHHGGSFSFPAYKPNYLSVANPNFTFTGIPVAATSGSTTPISCSKDAQCPAEAICNLRDQTCARIDYSRVALPDLNEYNLNENLGIGAGTNDITTYNCPDETPVFGAASGAIDWNCNSNHSETNVTADINADGEFNYFPFLMTGYRDWGNLWLHLQCTAGDNEQAAVPRLSQQEPSILEYLRKKVRRAHQPEP